VRRVAPGVAAVVCVGLLGLTGCGNDAGAATTKEAPAAVAASIPPSPLAGLAVVPGGYLKGSAADPGQLTGPFSRDAFVNTLSASPSEDLALLLNAGCTQGYQAFRTSPDKKKRFTVQLFKTGSKAKAKDLQQGFWGQDAHSERFAVPAAPEALTDARTNVAGAIGQVEAIAEASIVVGAMVARIKVSQMGTIENTPAPDTKLVATLVKLQKDRLTTKSG
jgi:hypothetical protein